MADDQDPTAKGRQKTVLGASGASEPPTIESDVMADTFMTPAPAPVPTPAGVTSPPEARPPGPVTGPPGRSPALGSAGQSTPAHTAPEIGSGGGGLVTGLEDLPFTDPEKWIGQVMADRYRILRLLGQGGMGVVYLAEHVVIEKKVALKVLNEELTHSRDVVSRFIGEAKAASRIGHENIIDITDFGTTADGGVFFVMEHLDGKDLADTLKAEGCMEWTRLRDVAVQMCRGLAAAHAKGIIHRDLKPENVFLIRHAGRDDFAKILDFGIAKFTGLEGGEPKKTKTGVIFGTPDYMSPEQAEGKRADHRVDIYALGVILYELATGRLPFVAETFMGVLHQHMAKPPQPPRELVADLPADFEAVILKALEKDAGDRFQSMNEFAAALEACTGQAAVPAPAATAQPSIPPLKPQSHVETGRVPALSDGDPPVSATAESAISLSVSPVVAPAEKKKSMGPIIAVIVVVVVGLGVGAFFLMKNRGKGGDSAKSPPGGMDSMTVATPAKADAAAPREAAMPPPMPIYKHPEKVTISVSLTNRSKYVRRLAKVYLDDKFIGKLPLKRFEVPYSKAERVLEIRAPRHRTVQIKFTPDMSQSWEKRMRRGKGTDRVSMRPPIRGMRPMGRMRPDMGMKPPDMRPVMIVMGLKDPMLFGMQ